MPRSFPAAPDDDSNPSRLHTPQMPRPTLSQWMQQRAYDCCVGSRWEPSLSIRCRGTMKRRTSAGHSVGVAIAAVTFGLAVTSGVAVASAQPGPTSCQARVPLRLLPVWARAGFSSAKPRMPYVLGQDGKIAAIQFADPLVSPPSPRYNNKILWVSEPAIRSGVQPADQRPEACRQHAYRSAGSPGRDRGAGSVDHQPPVGGMLASEATLVRPQRRARSALCDVDPLSERANGGTLGRAQQTPPPA